MRSGTSATVHALARATRSDRARSVDLLRAAAVLAVVLGHWTAVVLDVRDGRLTGQSLLALWPPGHAATWAFQVVPVLLLVGGYASAASWTSARRAGASSVSWLDARLRRLLRPTTAFVVLGAAAAAAARSAGADHALVRDAAWVSAIALWFLALYVPVVAATPLLVRADERAGLRVPLALALAVVAVDVLRLGAGVPGVGLLNHVLVWVCFFACGVAWRSGSLLEPGAVVAGLAVGGPLLATVLVAVGPYPLSMVGVPGAEVQNTAPPSLALLALGLGQSGLAVLVRGALERLARRPAVWTAVVAVNAVVMTVYLWHLVPVVLVGVLLHRLGLASSAPAGSPAWWALRPLWVLVCAMVLLVLVAALARVERPAGAQPLPPAVRATPVRVTLVVLGVVACSAGLVLLTVGGLSGDGPAGLPLEGLLPYLAGAALLAVAARARRGRPGAVSATRADGAGGAGERVTGIEPA